ncbi:unnamed protein product [Caenorhabditis bovis]|uniref:RING-CH-type domain-containing protein n=1 Tax=Caenorhabditis bovis TaxID=2654633 RepID=A0A8S1F9L4_9PELO|nr:unnamed protein product [Caenorhabditis bovis]
MGCIHSQEEDARDRSKRIDKMLKKEAESEQKSIKLLLLGAGESGKSTILKQMRIIHDDGYSLQECRLFRPVIYGNILQSLYAIIRAMAKLKIRFNDPDHEQDAIKLLKFRVTGHEDELPVELKDIIGNVCSDIGVHKALERSAEFQLNDSASYFIHEIARILESDYTPSLDDVLHARIRTTGIVEASFYFKDRHFRVFDVGGQRSERKKWIHCFEDVTAVIFCVALSEYDMIMLEDQKTNRMRESLKLFDSICNNEWFINTSIILFLNKKDLFEAKIRHSPITIAFPEYTGKNEFSEASTFIQRKFEEVNKRQNSQKEIYTHFTCATDTNNIRFVLDAVTDIIMMMDISMGPAVCRICMCGETSIPYLGKEAGEPLISPCCCSGTMGLYHRSCLEHWLTLTKTKQCEICKFRFQIEQKPRSFFQYLKLRGYRKRRADSDNRNPIVDFIFILAITPLAFCALYLCIRGAALAGQKYHIAFENRFNDEDGTNLQTRNETSMEFALFVFVAIILFFAYAVFMLVMCGSHIEQFRTWQKRNMVLFVIDQLDAEQSMHYNPQWKHEKPSLIKRVFGFLRNGRSRDPMDAEIARIETVEPRFFGDSRQFPIFQIPIEPVGLAPSTLNVNFNTIDNVSLHCPKTPIRGHMDVHASPDMYADDRFSPIMPTRPLSEFRKTQSIYSVCSFSNGRFSCSTPVHDRFNRIHQNDVQFSTFKDPAPTVQQENLEANHELNEMKGRFQVQRLETP